MIEFRGNKLRTLAALHHLMREANARRYQPSQYDLVKALFLADRSHLNKFGRPITFDRYVAMTHGPVPSFAYDCLKPNFIWPSLGMQKAPWTSRQEGKVHRFVAGGPDIEVKKLSKSDKTHLSDAIGTVMTLTFGQLRKLTHEDRAYVSAWRDEEDCFAFPMDMALLIDDADQETLEDLDYLSKMKA